MEAREVVEGKGERSEGLGGEAWRAASCWVTEAKWRLTAAGSMWRASARSCWRSASVSSGQKREDVRLARGFEGGHQRGIQYGGGEDMLGRREEEKGEGEDGRLGRKGMNGGV